MNLSCRCKFKTEQGKQEYDANEFFHTVSSFIQKIKKPPGWLDPGGCLFIITFFS
jgi:hypothetical protein